ncbi:MAG: hypothetical protein IPK79_05000 [Vampirovibrionales bacterium]|nr:hypothetical protein [Vampirovibrionales bacterium]
MMQQFSKIRSRWVWAAMATALVALAVAWGLLHPPAPLPQKASRPPLTAGCARQWIMAHPHSAYRLRRTIQLAGVEAVAADHRQRRQGFVVMSGVNRAWADRLFEQALTAQELETVANGLLALKNPAKPERLTLERLSVLDVAPDAGLGGAARQASRQLSARFYTSRHRQPRTLQLAAVRLAPSADGSENLAFTYSVVPSFEPALLTRFLQEADVGALSCSEP